MVLAQRLHLLMVFVGTAEMQTSYLVEFFDAVQRRSHCRPPRLVAVDFEKPCGVAGVVVGGRVVVVGNVVVGGVIVVVVAGTVVAGIVVVGATGIVVVGGVVVAGAVVVVVEGLVVVVGAWVVVVAGAVVVVVAGVVVVVVAGMVVVVVAGVVVVVVAGMVVVVVAGMVVVVVAGMVVGGVVVVVVAGTVVVVVAGIVVVVVEGTVVVVVVSGMVVVVVSGMVVVVVSGMVVVVVSGWPVSGVVVSGMDGSGVTSGGSVGFVSGVVVVGGSTTTGTVDTYNKRLGVPDGVPEIVSAVAELCRWAESSVGVHSGCAFLTTASAPATWGAAIDVPFRNAVAVSEEFQADLIIDPGAMMSTHEPRFENAENESPLAEAATVIAAGSRAGEDEHASEASFPAATATGMPASVARRTASSTAADVPPPRLMLITAGVVPWSVIAQSIPAITPDTEPIPEQSRTRTGTTVAFFATPYTVPAARAATCVPCP